MFILKKFRFMAWAVIIFLLLSLCAPLPRVTAGAEKIHPLVTAQAEQRFVPILIKLSQQADPEAVQVCLAQTAWRFQARNRTPGCGPHPDVAASVRSCWPSNSRLCWPGEYQSFISSTRSAEVHSPDFRLAARTFSHRNAAFRARAKLPAPGNQCLESEMLGVPSLHRQGRGRRWWWASSIPEGLFP